MQEGVSLFKTPTWAMWLQRLDHADSFPSVARGLDQPPFVSKRKERKQDPIIPEDQTTGDPEVVEEEKPPEGKWLGLDERTYNQLMKVHQSLGHPHNRTLSRILKDAGCREEVWRAAIHLKCHVCQRLRRPELEPVATSKGLPEPQEIILSDGFEWEHAVNHHMTNGILVLDEGSHLVISVIAREVPKAIRLGNISG